MCHVLASRVHVLVAVVNTIVHKIAHLQPFTFIHMSHPPTVHSTTCILIDHSHTHARTHTHTHVRSLSLINFVFLTLIRNLLLILTALSLLLLVPLV